MTINNLDSVKKSLIEEINKRLELKIIEETNASLIKDLIENSETVTKAMAIAQLGTTYKNTGFYYDKRIEKVDSNVRYLSKNSALSFITNPTGINHKLIIGDNYEALLNLLITHKNKIDVIYIDPPYGVNSMGEFAKTNYNNSISRDNLLSMLYPRLCLAKELLTEDGVIFVSIDDKNHAHIKLLMDDIFEEKNFICNFIWKKTDTPSNLGNKVRPCTEYVLCYEKTLNSNRYNGLREGGNDTAPLLNKDNKVGILKIPSDSIEFSNKLNGKVFKKGIIENEKNSENSIELMEDFEVGISNELILKAKFRWSQEYLDDQLSKGTKLFCKTESLAIRYLKSEYKTILPKTLLDKDEGFGTNEEGSSQCLELGLNFDYPKPVSLIKNLLNMVSNEDSIILDFFAGSGTTGQAVLELNKDGGNRQFIICTNNEKNEEKHPNGIAYDVTSKRLKRTMDGKCYDGSSDFKWIQDNKSYGDNLEVFEIEKINNRDKNIFSKIDETNYGKKFFSIQEKIKWVCDNFENTQKNFGDE